MKGDTQQQEILRDLLEPIFEIYKDYACSDAINFAGNVGCMKKVQGSMEAADNDDWNAEREQAWQLVKKRIEAKTNLDKQLEASAFGAALGAAQGYTLEGLKLAADNIDAARSAVCTTFAVSGANRLLDLQNLPEYQGKITRIEIVARKFGHRGTHCYVILNRKEGSSLKDLKTWGESALIADPWLCSLQNPSIYTPAQFELTGFIKGLECNFDTANPNLINEKLQKIEETKFIKDDYIKALQNGDLPHIQKNLALYQHSVESVKLGEDDNLFTIAIKFNQNSIFKWLWEQIKDPNFITKKSARILNSAIAANNIDIVEYLHTKGVNVGIALDQALDIALQTGDDKIFAYVFEQEIAKDPKASLPISTLARIPLLKLKQGIPINHYLSRLPNDIISKLIIKTADNKMILEEISSKLDKANDGFRKRFPNAFVDSPAANVPVALPTAPQHTVPGSTPPLPPAAPPSDFFKAASKSVRAIERTKLRQHRTDYLEKLKEDIATDENFIVTSEMLAHLGDYIDEYAKQYAVLEAFSDLESQLSETLEAQPEKNKIVKALLVIDEHAKELDNLIQTLESLQDKFFKELNTIHSATQSGSGSNQHERLQFLFNEYQSKYHKIISNVTASLVKIPQSLNMTSNINQKRKVIDTHVQNMTYLLSKTAANEPLSLLDVTQTGNFELVKLVALNSSRLSERDSQGKTFLDYLKPEEIDILVDYLLKNGASNNAFKIAVLQQDMSLIKKLQKDHNVSLFKMIANDDSAWNYLPQDALAESKLSKISYFFSKHETFSHWINQQIKDELDNDNQALQNPMQFELMQINETLARIREPNMPIETYIDYARQKTDDAHTKLDALEAKYKPVMKESNAPTNEHSTNMNELKASMNSLRLLLNEIEMNIKGRMVEENKSSIRPE